MAPPLFPLPPERLLPIFFVGRKLCRNVQQLLKTEIHFYDAGIMQYDNLIEMQCDNLIESSLDVNCFELTQLLR